MSVAEAITRLQAQLNGRVITSRDPAYDRARAVFNGAVDRHPAAIAQPATAAEVARAVTLTRDHGLELAVRGGGHSGPGYGVTEGGIVLDLTRLRGLTVDVDGRTAWAQTGLTAGEYTAALAEHGLVTGFGDTGSVGIGGLTLGGGMGFLSRRYGLTVDNLLAAEVVTADGEILQVDAEHHPDLFWAIRGGGGNFGVATALRFRTHPLASVVGGMLLLPATPEVISGIVDAARAAPDELCAIASVMVAPPAPFIPAEHHGSLVVVALMCYAGPAEAGQRALAPFRALATPLVDMLRPIRYQEMFLPEDPDQHPVVATHTGYLDTFEDAAAEAILAHLRSFDAPMRAVQLRVLGGAISRIPDDATAYAHRNRPMMVNVAAIGGQPGELPAHQAWTADVAAALGMARDGEAYANFLAGDAEARARAAYPNGAWERLREVKARYDPTNLFRLNVNIPPG